MSMGFRHRQAIGELMFAAVTCRSDILFATMCLSQCSATPAACYYTAVKRVFRYLWSTITDGLCYWRAKPDTTLPCSMPPTTQKDNYNFTLPFTKPFLPNSFADAD